VKPSIHPAYQRIAVTCACGATYEVGSTKKSLRIDVCAKCHPFYTGKQRIVDSGGRVERFLRKYERAKAAGAR
jgi:large subunit ribosomal protein L31